METIIEIKNITKVYDTYNSKITVFQDTSFKIKEGEFVIIMGPSGSGKSTFLNIIAMLEKANSGLVKLYGNDIDKLNYNEKADLRLSSLGVVYQGFHLIPFLSAKNNVKLPLILAPKTNNRKQLNLIAINILNQVGLSKRINHLPSELSFGEQQRVAIARSLVNNPNIVLADEPTGSLDSMTSQEIITLMKLLNQKRKTAFLVATHDEAFLPVADRVLVISNKSLTEKE
ncbi:ABC transporter ATP-binding protein [Syntrophomonas curvata]